jgi:hypothetical protein
MHRPMKVPYDLSEEEARRLEYSEMLKRLPYSDLSAESDPKNDSRFPARILSWQYEQGLLTARVNSISNDQPGFFKPPKSVVEWRSEYARNLAVYLVSKQARKSEQYLVKLCRKFELQTARSLVKE